MTTTGGRVVALGRGEGGWAALYDFFSVSHARREGSTGLILSAQTAFALGAFATTITTLSCALMEWHGLSTANAFVGNFFFIAGIGMVLSAQWELVRGNSYNYTVFSAYGDYHSTKTNILKNKDDLLVQACSTAGSVRF